MRSDLPKGHIALLLTDIDGSTRLLHRLGTEGYAHAQAEHRDLLRAAFQIHNGVEVDTQGDAFFYVFPSAANALAAAVAGTRALARHPWRRGEAVKVRMGIHSGEPQRTEEGYVGMVVNTTARVAAAGHGGQILISADAAGELGRALDAGELTLKDLGNHRLKDLNAPRHLYQVVVPELPADFPPLRTAESRPNNLPGSLTPFIGRSRLVVELRDLVKDPRTRAITLLGPGGTGKSRLALELARELLHGFTDGAWFVGLAPIREARFVLPAIAAALGVKEQSGQALEATLASYLTGRELLLLLDNFEHVTEAAREVARLLAACPHIKIIATSRQPLRLKGERRVQVPPLALPAPEAAFTAIAESEAVRLFVETAEQACWDFELNEDNAADVVEICRRVDALPLAIELATVKLATMSVSELLAALEDRLGVLTDGSVDLLDHQQTLRSLVAWSYDLLDEPEQRLWRRLAVFAGGGTLEAVRSVCDAAGEYRFPADIDNLVMKSLVNLEFGAVDSDGSKRAVMLETLREYAAERLSETAEADEMRHHHARWYRRFAEHAGPLLRGAETEHWLARLDRDLSNLRAAMSWGLEGGGVPEDAAAIAGAVWFYFYDRGLLQEGTRWLERCTAAAPRDAARAMLGLANLERVQGRPAEARGHCEAALAAFRESADEEGTAEALSYLGAILQHLGELELAESCLSEAATRLRALGTTNRLAFTLVSMGIAKHLRGDLAGAKRDYLEGLELGRRLGDPNDIATALVNLGEIQLMDGNREEAAALLSESLSIYHGLGVRNAVAYCLELLAGIALAEDQYERTALLFGAADKVREVFATPLESFNLERYHRDIDRARTGAGPAVFATAWDRGRQMPLQKVVDFALKADADTEG